MVGFAQTNNALDLSDAEMQFQSVEVTLFGRFMMQDKREFPCQVQSMSSGSATLITPHIGSVGDSCKNNMDRKPTRTQSS